MPPPADPSGPPVATAEDHRVDPGERPHRRLRCERCLEVVSTRHAWDAMTCRCGELMVTGTPWAPSVRWASSPGGGWSEVDEDDGKLEPDPEPPSHAVSIGYLRHLG